MNRRTIKKSISDIVFFAGAFSGNYPQKDGLRVLNYHSITALPVSGDRYQMTTPRELFDGQMRFLKESGYKVLTCGEAFSAVGKSASLPPRTICITFDDGFKDNLVNALPVLRKYGFKATIFLTIDFIGKDDSYLDWKDIDELAMTGLFSFGSHAMSHRKLSLLGDDEIIKEIGDSKKILEDRIKAPVDIFAYPFGCYGSFDDRSITAVRDSGYKAAVTTIAGFNFSGDDPYLVKRMRISWQDDTREFSKQLCGAYDWYRLWQRITTLR